MNYPNRIGNWWLGDKLGSGFSGSIFRASNVHTDQIVAVKIQYANHECPTNRYERGFYPSLQGGEGMPTLWASGIEGIWDFLVIDLLGPSLDNLFRKSGKDCMDLRSVCSIAMQVISRLEFMHGRGILHRDIQLGNCVVGLGPKEKTIYMIDFGFSKRYIDPYTRRHIPDSKAKRDFIGNYWFTSVGVHCKGKVPSRRDDLEAAALMFIHLLTPGGLSWTRNGIPKNNAQHDRIIREKRNSKPEDLCKGLPPQFEEFLRYCRRLKFAECPDYARWKEEFSELAKEEGFPGAEEFIWPPPPISHPKPHSTHNAALRRTPAPQGAENIEQILNDLANLKLDDRPVLGDRKNIINAVQQAKTDGKKPATEVSMISDETDDIPSPVVARIPKAAQLNKLTAAVYAAGDNNTLSQVVLDFVVCLQSNRSRTLTKEGFAFLDALYKQLGDPSTFAVPLRTSRTRSGDKEQQQVPLPEPKHVKLEVLAALRRTVGTASRNKALAKMVADFGAVTNKSSGRTVTKDGFAFLEGLAARLKTIR
ncbi:hypothetical protein PILCRDRAFT_95199 [Piloderma croceum F 1598]|uniref:Protein kinase domain-containing protein n=1 Tax=Piloderma croceum (strain F 1598) TaxID=765440 RepID=A0A0C3CHL8_PILCF|nr:hypothetical protein PILCRDRAFT_95199 [Piloderma croceum F 1598]